MMESRPAHPSAAEGIAQQVQGCDRRMEEVVGSKDKHPVLNDSSDVHGERRGLAYKQENSLRP